MTDDEWQTISMLLDKGFKWREPFGESQSAAYQILLDGYDPEQIAGAMQRLIATGQVFGPTPGELVAQIRRDPSKPTFDEMLTLIKAALRAWNLPLTGNYGSEAEMEKIRKQRVLDRAAGMHPLVARFVERHGVCRLQDEVGELEGQYGAIRRQELEAAWQRHCDAFEDREIHALTAPRRNEIGRLDPLAALGLSAPRELGSGVGA